MHEFSLCESLVNAVLAEMDKVKEERPVRLVKAKIVVGRLRQVVPDNMLFAFECLTKDTPAAGAELEIEEAPVVARCLDCGWQGEPEERIFACRQCESVNIEIIEGREIYLAELEVAVDSDGLDIQEDAHDGKT